jgi:uncharacterized protein involved in exopolysaccharide biosynthesis
MTQASPAAPIQDDTIDVIALIRLLWAHKFLIAASTLLAGVAAVALALTATHIYRADAVVAPAFESNLGGASASLGGRLGGLASLAGIDVGRSGPGGQHAQSVLQSRRLVEEFISRNDLVGVLLPPGDDQTLWRAVQKFRDSVVSMSRDDTDGTTTITVEWTDPATAAHWANGLVTLANEIIRAQALAESQRNVDYLKKQAETTNVVEMQRVMYELIQSETKNLMLANARVDYAFTVIDPAVVPESRDRPKRRLMVSTGLAIGFILASLFVLGRDTVRRYRAREAAGAWPRT